MFHDSISLQRVSQLSHWFHRKSQRIRRTRHARVESLEPRTLLTATAATLADAAFWGASAAGNSGNASAFSADAQLIAFESDAGNLTLNDFNGSQDIFVRDIGSGVTTLVSMTPGGLSGSVRRSIRSSALTDVMCCLKAKPAIWFPTTRMAHCVTCSCVTC